MTEIVSGYGLLVQVVASITFPAGFSVTQFADDVDPFDLPSMQTADKAMGLNGDLIGWSKATPILLTLGVIPGSADDINLGILFNNNRVGRGKLSVRDIITLTGIYPDGKQTTLANGIITDGMIANSVSSAGRQKSKPYIFAFENGTSS